MTRIMVMMRMMMMMRKEKRNWEIQILMARIVEASLEGEGLELKMMMTKTRKIARAESRQLASLAIIESEHAASNKARVASLEKARGKDEEVEISL